MKIKRETEQEARRRELLVQIAQELLRRRERPSLDVTL